MAKFIIFTTIVARLLSEVLASPAPLDWEWNAMERREAEQVGTTTVTKTLTKTVTTTSISTLTKCSTGTTTTPVNMTTTTTPRPVTTKTTQKSTTSTQPMSTSSVPPSGEPVFDGCTYNVPEAGSFKNKKVFNFFQPGIPDGLYASNYMVYDTYNGLPYDHKFETSNVYTDGDFLNLKVPGFADPSTMTDKTISCAEVVTTENNILYGSVRTNAIFSTVPGTCQGIFYYLDDTQECDIEYLSDATSKANNIYQSSSSGAPIPLWYSNQALRSGQQPTNGVGAAPWDVTAVHEYRIDWTKDFTAFYLDGVLQKKYTTNVPTKPGSWIWNNWANGDANWSVGPPREDNVMRIQNITMYYNTVDDKSC